MPRRLTPLVNKYVYHIYNRAIDGRVIFKDEADYKHALICLRYYLNIKPVPKLSTFLKFSEKTQQEIFERVRKENKTLVTPIAFCYMPDHFHFLITQNTDGGISDFAANFQNSYTRYFNTKYNRVGPILLPRFKGVRMESDNQLLHVSRYIHLNPYSSGIVKNLDELSQYPWSSLPEYLYPNRYKSPICDKTLILTHFNKTGRYKNFVFNQAGYQKSLKQIREILLEH